MGHAGAGLQTGEQRHGHPRARASGANLDILLLKQEMKDSVLQDPTSFFQCILIEYLSCAGCCQEARVLKDAVATLKESSKEDRYINGLSLHHQNPFGFPVGSKIVSPPQLE